MKTLITFALIGSLAGGASLDSPSTEVQVAGNIDQIIHKGNLSANVALDTLNADNLFAIGHAEGLKGEITVMYGKPVRTKIVDTFLRTDTLSTSKASLLVYTHVSRWKGSEVLEEINSLKQLEEMVLQAAIKENIDVSKPFPFMLKSWCKNIHYHVIDWRDSTEHTPENHKMFAHELIESNTESVVMGFYSTRNEGIFTEHNSNIYANVVPLNDHNMVTGHLNNIETLGTAQLFLPLKGVVRKPEE
jgi:acetolactate decarboxylase